MTISNRPPEDQGPNRSTPQGSQAEHMNSTDKSRTVADIVALINLLPDVRSIKVEEIKKAVDSGSYVIDARKVAEGILKEL